MARDPLGERWPEVYREAPETFACFAAAEDRDGLIPALLKRHLAARGRDVLELGCGTGRWTPAVSAGARRFVALEPAAGMLALAREHAPQDARLLRGRAQALPFAPQTFDVAFAGFVFANLRPKLLVPALDEVRRVLRPGASLWVIENAGGDGFDELRASAGLPTPRETLALTEQHAFEAVASVATLMEFGTNDAARHVLGTILGPRMADWLGQHPHRRLEHRIQLLRWTPEPL